MEPIAVIKQVIDGAVKSGLFSNSEDVIQVHQAYEIIKTQLEQLKDGNISR